MVVSKNRNIKLNLNVNNQRIEQVTKFNYLGCYITENIDPEVEKLNDDADTYAPRLWRNEETSNRQIIKSRDPEKIAAEMLYLACSFIWRSRGHNILCKSFQISRIVRNMVLSPYMLKIP